MGQFMKGQSMKQKLDNYEIVKKIGKGATSTVFLVKNIKEEYFAAKVIKIKRSEEASQLKLKQEFLSNELQCFLELDQGNIIKAKEAKFYGKLVQFKGKQKVSQKQVMYIIMEYCPGFNLYDYLEKEPFEETITRFYVKQIAEAVSYMHKQYIVHRDLKLENILIDEQYNTKLADFGYAKLLLSDPQILETYCGTKNYMAPEIIEPKKIGNFYFEGYKGYQVDVFSLGIIIFEMKSGQFPFWSATLSDSWYNRFINNNQKFWQLQQGQYKNVHLSEQFIDMINKMLVNDPDKRISIEEVLAHPWLTQNETASKEVVINEMQRRKTQIISQKSKSERIYLQQIQSKQQQKGQQKGKKYQSSGGFYFNNEGKCITLLKESMNIFKYFQIMTKYNPDIILSTLVKIFSNFTDQNIEIADESYRFKVKGLETEFGQLSIEVEIFAFEFDVSNPKAEIAKEEEEQEEQEEQFFLIDFILIKGTRLGLNKLMKIFYDNEEIKQLSGASLYQA